MIISSTDLPVSRIVLHSGNSLVPKMCSVDPMESATGFHRIRGYISVMSSFMFTYLLIEGIMFVKVITNFIIDYIEY